MSDDETALTRVADRVAALRALSQSVTSHAEWRQVGRYATPEEIAYAETQRDPRHCIGHSSRTHLPCALYAMHGQRVCLRHGGRAPQVLAAAERRLTAAALPALKRMIDLSQQSSHIPVAQRATADLLDRAGIGAVVRARVASAEAKGSASGGITVNIGFIQADRQTLDAGTAVTDQIVNTLTVEAVGDAPE